MASWSHRNPEPSRDQAASRSAANDRAPVGATGGASGPTTASTDGGLVPAEEPSDPAQECETCISEQQSNSKQSSANQFALCFVFSCRHQLMIQCAPAGPALFTAGHGGAIVLPLRTTRFTNESAKGALMTTCMIRVARVAETL